VGVGAVTVGVGAVFVLARRVDAMTVGVGGWFGWPEEASSWDLDRVITVEVPEDGVLATCWVTEATGVIAPWLTASEVTDAASDTAMTSLLDC
jgi:hypothetical protein